VGAAGGDGRMVECPRVGGKSGRVGKEFWLCSCIGSLVRNVVSEFTQRDRLSRVSGECVSAATVGRSVRASSWSKRLAPGRTRGAEYSIILSETR
jgi:hypothetical protein